MSDHPDNASSTPGDDYTEIVNWLRGLEAGTHLIWGDLHATTGDAHSGWVDVSVQGCELGFNWLWTVDAPDAGDDVANFDDPTTIACYHDVSIWAVWDTDIMWYLDDPVSVVAVGETPGAATMELLEAAVAALPERRSVTERGGWSVAALNAALNAWCVQHVGRDDITFDYSADVGENDPRLHKANAIMDAIDGGTMETYEIGEGVRISSTAFDQLLALDTETAAALSAGISDIARTLRANNDD